MDPATITDFQGFTAQAYPVGAATGSDGTHYNLEAGMADWLTYLQRQRQRVAANSA